MLRLQQVTFMALHQFLGLSTELISNVMVRIVKTHHSIEMIGNPKFEEN